MSRGQPPATRPHGDLTKDQIKAAAQLLFARHGIDGVTVQQIVQAAGQRNKAALQYHFGSKEELIRQLVVEGAKALDDRRNHLLDGIEQSGKPVTVREVLRILVLPVLELANEERWKGYVQFSSNLQMSHREIFRSALNNRWNSGYVRCFNHLKKLLNRIPGALLEQRLSIFVIYGNAITSVREFELSMHKQPNRFWSKSFTIENILDTLEATITCSPSVATLAELGPQQR
jgi:AcrR family transcriptional regulator